MYREPLLQHQRPSLLTTPDVVDKLEPETVAVEVAGMGGAGAERA